MATLVDRAKNICVTPKTEWPVIAQEAKPTGELLAGYVVPLAAIGAIAGFIGGSLVGHSLPFLGTFRVPLVAGVGLAVFTFVMAIVGVYIVSIVINALAPTFGGEKDSRQALKVAVYSYTPAWIAAALNILPGLGILAFFGALYGLYLLYLGLPRLMKCSADKAIGYTALVVVCAIVVSVVIGMVGTVVTGAGLATAGLLGGGLTRHQPSADVQFDKNSPMGKLQVLGRKLEESNRKMEIAEKSGDAGASAAAAFEGLGTLLGGGSHVDPVTLDQLKPFVPDTFAGLPRKSSSAERSGVATLMVSKASATYGDGGPRYAKVEVSDTGGVSGLVGLAGWIGGQGEEDNDDRTERTQKIDGRLVHERLSKKGGTNEYAIVLGDRFIVSAEGRGIRLPELEKAVSDLDLARLEAMKNVGVAR
jgi:hypothetical protein